jgi:secreted trypsin-like serine protease
MTLRKQLVQYALSFVIVMWAAISVQNSVQSADDGTPTPTTFARESAIVGGQPADPGEWPWQVFIHAGPYMCGGSLIQQQWVVTAAHCVLDDQNNVLTPAEIKVTLGEHNRSKTEGTEQKIQIIQVIPHPAYDSKTNDHDIALLQLATPAILNAAVEIVIPVTSPADDALMVAGAQAVVTGWGTTTEGGSTSAQLLEVTVPLVSNGQCDLSYGIITDNMLCAGYAEGGKDSCQGDSGGPLVVPTRDNRWALAGIVSFGYGCGRAKFYGVYTRVSRYIAWMDQQMNNSVPTPTVTPTVTPVVTETPTSVPTTSPLSSTVSISGTLFPDQELTLVISGTNGTKVMIEMPVGAVDTPTEITYGEAALPAQFLDTIRLDGRLLMLKANQDNQPVTSLSFHQAVTMTIDYTDQDITMLDETTLALYALRTADGKWSNNEVTLIAHLPETNRLVVAITQATDYALGAPNRLVYLPLISQ